MQARGVRERLPPHPQRIRSLDDPGTIPGRSRTNLLKAKANPEYPGFGALPFLYPIPTPFVGHGIESERFLLTIPEWTSIPSRTSRDRHFSIGPEASSPSPLSGPGCVAHLQLSAYPEVRIVCVFRLSKVEHLVQLLLAVVDNAVTIELQPSFFPRKLFCEERIALIPLARWARRLGFCRRSMCTSSRNRHRCISRPTVPPARWSPLSEGARPRLGCRGPPLPSRMSFGSSSSRITLFSTA